MKRLTELEKEISNGQGHFITVGRALMEIRDKRLYKEALYDTFELYVRGRWDIGRSHAYRMMAFYEIIRNLSPIGDILPENESQVRPLAGFAPFEQREIWKKFIQSGTPLTALAIKTFVKKLKKTTKSKADGCDRMSSEYKTAVKAMLDQVRMAQDDHWQGTSRQAALLWNRVIREKILEKGAGHG